LSDCSLRDPLSKALLAILARGGGWLRFRSPATIQECGAGYPVRNTRMAGLVAIDSEVRGTSLHLWLSLVAFICVQFITFAVKSYYIYGQFLLHLWLVLHLRFLLHLRMIQQTITGDLSFHHAQVI